MAASATTATPCVLSTTPPVATEFEFILPRAADLPSQQLAPLAGVRVLDVRYCLPPNGEMSPDATSPRNRALVSVTVTAAAPLPGDADVTCAGAYLRLAPPYDRFWNAVWAKRAHSGDLACVSRTAGVVAGTSVYVFTPVQSGGVLEAPNKPGLYNLRYEWVDAASGVPVSRHLFRMTLDVTCDLAEDAGFCDGVKRFVRDACVPTAKPCGLDLVPCNPALPGCSLAGVAPATLCHVYPCNATERRCGVYPAAVTRRAITDPTLPLHAVDPAANEAACIGCQPAPCKPDCGKGRKCGSDGCGGYCGKLPLGACDPGLECSAAGLCIEPSGPTTSPGTCNNPFDLLNATQNAHPDATYVYNLTLFERYAAGDGEYQLRPLADQLAALPSDGRTVPASGLLARLTYTNVPPVASDQTPVTCSSSGGVPDLIYRFHVAAATGFEAYLLDLGGDPEAVDTLLALHGGDGTDAPAGPVHQCQDVYAADNYPANVPCADDSAPPGGYGSRIFIANLKPGTYYLVVTSYAAQAAAPFQLWVKFTDTRPPPLGFSGAAPKCNDKFCGDDEVGFVCNPSSPCAAPTRCRSGYCVDCPVDTSTYVPDCQQRQCGAPADGCSAEPLCGSCKPDQRVCDLSVGQCVVDFACDPLVPTCQADTNYGRKADVWCGNDCAWHKTDETLFDLVPNQEREILPSLVFERREFGASSCAFQESCVLGAGTRVLFRQSTAVHNQGMVGFTPGDVQSQVRNFIYAACHQHFHFLDFASFGVRSPAAIPAANVSAGALVLGGGKLSYCMEDTRQFMRGPRVACEGAATCEQQGIQTGWTDEYNANLDCQWFDATQRLADAMPRALEVALGCIDGATNATVVPVPPACQAERGALNRWYLNEVNVNVARRITEYSFRNNLYAHAIFFPYVPSTEGRVEYSEFFRIGSPVYRNPCARLPAGMTSAFCTRLTTPYSVANNVSMGLPYTW